MQMQPDILIITADRIFLIISFTNPHTPLTTHGPPALSRNLAFDDAPMPPGQGKPAINGTAYLNDSRERAHR